MIRSCFSCKTGLNDLKSNQIIARHDDGWVLCQNSQGAFGVVPGNYLTDTPEHPLDADPESLPAGTIPAIMEPDDEGVDSLWQDPRTVVVGRGDSGDPYVGSTAAPDDQQLMAQRAKEVEVEQMLLDGEELTKMLDEKVSDVTAVLSSAGLAAFKGSPTQGGVAVRVRE